jgi:hypothetical protein
VLHVANAVQESIGIGVGVEALSQWEGFSRFCRQCLGVEPLTLLAAYGGTVRRPGGRGCGRLLRRQGRRVEGRGAGGALGAGVGATVPRGLTTQCTLPKGSAHGRDTFPLIVSIVSHPPKAHMMAPGGIIP